MAARSDALGDIARDTKIQLRNPPSKTEESWISRMAEASTMFRTMKRCRWGEDQVVSSRHKMCVCKIEHASDVHLDSLVLGHQDA